MTTIKTTTIRTTTTNTTKKKAEKRREKKESVKRERSCEWLRGQNRIATGVEDGRLKHTFR